jgi:hypothetical protein
VLRPYDAPILTRRARAVLGADELYRALVSSYVRRNGTCKLMFHQQTPLAE